MKEETSMNKHEQVATAPEQSSDIQQKVQEMREFYADAPEVGKTALENALREMELGEPASQMESAGRVGSRQGTVSELTMLIPFAEGGAKRLRGLLQLREGNFQETDRVGTVHDMRFVFLDNDTKLLFATAYDGEWDAYIDDFATKIPNELDLLFCNCEGWPGIRNPSVKDWIANYQIPAQGWYVANPNLSVAEAKRLQRVGKALDEFLDKVSE
ncbi:hypothetical protein KSF_101570 [Reticulibacter mediterranei]|uniref:Uncharacterized protein n=1 Tax=Reticulibacter mediterranei TaxID=2778369 RepID=A0A8J3IQI6_9CHLR|nr:hypothetical protein [Reticulibacter mediterranei]GHP00110.1 hypothetical protein KSF_101570 [Reticulibacter mediterranei]